METTEGPPNALTSADRAASRRVGRSQTTDDARLGRSAFEERAESSPTPRGAESVEGDLETSRILRSIEEKLEILATDSELSLERAVSTVSDADIRTMRYSLSSYMGSDGLDPEEMSEAVVVRICSMYKLYEFLRYLDRQAQIQKSTKGDSLRRIRRYIQQIGPDPAFQLVHKQYGRFHSGFAHRLNRMLYREASLLIESSEESEGEDDLELLQEMQATAVKQASEELYWRLRDEELHPSEVKRLKYYLEALGRSIDERGSPEDFVAVMQQEPQHEYWQQSFATEK